MVPNHALFQDIADGRLQRSRVRYADAGPQGWCGPTAWSPVKWSAKREAWRGALATAAFVAVAVLW